MSGKYMKTRKIVIPTLTLIILASQMFSCASTSKEDALNVIQNVPNIEIEVSEQAGTDDQDQATIQQLDWTKLGELTTHPELRKAIEDALNITTDSNGIKDGMIYVNPKTLEKDNNSTLFSAMHNTNFTQNMFYLSSIGVTEYASL